MTAVPDSSRTLSVKPANRMTADTVSPALLPQQAAGNRYAGTAYQVNKITYASGLTRLATAPKPQPKPVELTPEEEFSLLQKQRAARHSDRTSLICLYPPGRSRNAGSAARPDALLPRAQRIPNVPLGAACLSAKLRRSPILPLPTATA